jgi:hypothetical protein
VYCVEHLNEDVLNFVFSIYILFSWLSDTNVFVEMWPLMGQLSVLFCDGSNNKFNFLNAEFNDICYLLALLGAHPILHISRIRVKI